MFPLEAKRNDEGDVHLSIPSIPKAPALSEEPATVQGLESKETIAFLIVHIAD